MLVLCVYVSSGHAQWKKCKSNNYCNNYEPQILNESGAKLMYTMKEVPNLAMLFISEFCSL